MNKIDIPKCDSKRITHTNFDYDEIIFFDKHLIHRTKCNAVVYDEDKGMDEERYYEFEHCYFKDKITFIDCGYVNSEDCFSVDIYYSSGSAGAYFETMEEALEVRDKILKWLIAD